MAEWLLARRVPWILVAAGLDGLVIAVLADGSSSAPAVLGGGQSAVHWSAYAVLIPSLVLVAGLDGTRRSTERSAARSMRLWDALLVAALCILLVLVALSAQSIGGQALEPAVIRNAFSVPLLAGTFGMLLDSGRAGALLMGVLLATQSYSLHARGAGVVRFFQPEAATGPWAALALLAVGCFVAGLFLRSRVPVASEHRLL